MGGLSVDTFYFSAYEAKCLSKWNIIIWEGHGSSREGHGSIREVNFLNGHILKFQLDEHLAYQSQIILIKEFGKFMEACGKDIEESGKSFFSKNNSWDADEVEVWDIQYSILR